MTIRIMDGFDLYANLTGVAQKWGVVGANSTLTTTGGRFGGGAVQFTGSVSTLRHTDTVNEGFISAGFAFKGDNSVDVRAFGWTDTVSAAASADLNAGLEILTDGSLRAEGDGGITLGTSAVGLIVPNVWHYVELQVSRAVAPSGVFKVYVNGTLVLDVTGDTQESTASGAFHIGAVGTADALHYFDDVYISSDASALPSVYGDVKIETLLPDGDTAQADWTPLSGTGFSNIDDALGTNGDGDTTYISDTTLNNKSEFDLGNLSETPTTIAAVSHSSRHSKTDSGTIEYTPYIDSAGTESAGTATAPADGAYGMVSDVYELDPNTAAAWTTSGVNALKSGVEITG